MTISFLGLGRMGRILAGNLLDDGHELLVWNRTASATDELAARGAVVAQSAAEAVEGATVVMTALFGPEAVQDVVLATTAWQPGSLWIDVTTVSPEDTRRYAAWAASQRVRYVHAPVIGTLGPARRRQLGAPIGGAAADVEVARAIVSSWADPGRVHVHATPAQAATEKLLANLGLAVAMQAMAEALRLGAAEGMSTDAVLSALDGTVLAPMAAMKGAVVASGEYQDTQFSADLLAKDVQLMMQTVRDPLPATAAALGSLLAAQRAGRGDEDFAVIARRA